MPETVSTAPTLMQALANAAASTADLARFERIWEIYEKVCAREDARAMLIKEEEFNAAMSVAQKNIIAAIADKNNTQTHSRYATYYTLDKAVRNHYTAQGFGLTFKFGEVTQEIAIVNCHVTRAGFTRIYSVPVPIDGKGAKGGDVMTKTHALKSGMTYAMSMLLIMIFNIPIKHDPADDDGNAANYTEVITGDQVIELRSKIEAVGADEQRFLRYMKIGSLTVLPVKDFGRAMMELSRKDKL